MLHRLLIAVYYAPKIGVRMHSNVSEYIQMCHNDFFKMFFFSFSQSVLYKSKGDELIISGSGTITQAGVRSKGDFFTVKKITIEEGPNIIDNEAFRECFELTSLYIPSSVTEIRIAFLRNKKLVNIKVSPNNNHYMTDEQGILYTKDKKTILRVPAKEITIPEGVETIKKWAFQTANAYLFKSIIFPSTLRVLEVHSINECCGVSASFRKGSVISYIECFTFCTWETIKIPPSVIELRDYAFTGLTVTNLIFEANSHLRIIKSYAFYLTTLNEINLPDSLETIQSNAFENCEKFVSVHIGASCRNIQHDSFNGCGTLKEFTVSESNPYFYTIDNMIMKRDNTQIVFINNNNERLTIPDTCISISNIALQTQENLVDVTFNNNPKWHSVNGVVYSKDSSQLCFVCGGVVSVEALPSITTINTNAAAFCKKLVSFKFLGNICTTIQNNAFMKSGIKRFELADSVIEIHPYAFDLCRNLETFVISKNSKLCKIWDWAFHGSSLREIYIPKDVIEIRYYAFFTSDLEVVNFAPNSKLNNVFIVAFSITKIKKINLPNSLKIINDEVFKENFYLKEVTFGSNLESIGKTAFKSCTLLESIDLPSSCTTIDVAAFDSCTSLKTIKYSSLSNVDALAFKNCGIETFLIQPSLQSIKPNTFIDCKKLVTFTVAESHSTLKSINGVVFTTSETLLYLYPPGRKTALISKHTLEFRENAFSGCTILEEVKFEPESQMKILKNGAFYGCFSLSKIVFPPILEKIESDCFYKCISLKTITLPPSITFIETNAFCGCTSLRFVKYCGTNNVGGDFDAFPENINEVYVNKLYPYETLCSHKAVMKLDDNCEYIPDPTFRHSIIKRRMQNYIYLL